MGVGPSPLFRLPRFILEMICIDVLRALDLGFSQLVIGNLIWEYMNEFATGPNQEKRMQEVWVKLKAHSKDMNTKNRIQALTNEMVRRDGKGPCMRTKGAETRNLVPFAFSLAQEMHEARPTRHTMSVRACVASLMDFYMLMSLDVYDVEAGSAACRKCVGLYRALSMEAAAHGREKDWKMKPKLHMFQELAEFQAPQMGNPRNFWTYQDEDFVGWVAKIAHSRGGAKAAATAATRVMQRYRGLSANPGA